MNWEVQQDVVRTNPYWCSEIERRVDGLAERVKHLDEALVVLSADMAKTVQVVLDTVEIIARILSLAHDSARAGGDDRDVRPSG